MSTLPFPSYVLITPARNEETFIDGTIRSVVSQTVLPLRWVIVSDGSTDRTDEIVRSHLPRHGWMELVRMPAHDDRQFASKVRSFEAGYRRVQDLRFEIVGNLDADLSFEPGLFEGLLNEFRRNPSLGVAGPPFVEGADGRYDYRFTNIEHVSGACQLFRRSCFESIGGYVPVKRGGIDWIAVTTARMKGWKTRTFTERTVFHHRTMGTGQGTALGARYSLGRQDYDLGNHPLWELFRAFYQMRRKPRLVGGLALFLGFASAAARRREKSVSAELEAFVRREQVARLRRKLRLSRARAV